MSSFSFYASAIVCMIAGASLVHQYYQPLSVSAIPAPRSLCADRETDLFVCAKDLPELIEKRKQEILDELAKKKDSK